MSFDSMLTPENLASIAIIYIICHLTYVIYNAIGLIQFNPFVELKPLSAVEQQILSKNFPIYSRLPKRYKEKCNQRIVWFRSKKKFVFYGEVAKQEELTLILSASTVFMTLGLKNYKMMQSLFRIVVYPSQYYSKINRRHHLGEYNPRFKTIILSADSVWEGFKISDDNINLAMHEFAHALSFEMQGNRSWEARRFRLGLRKMENTFKIKEFRSKLVASQYFREYGMTNLQEFFSVAIENYFETPSDFHADFPELFAIVQRMLNFDFEISCVFHPSKISPES